MTAPLARINEDHTPLLTLEEWRESIGYNPFHFFQVANEKIPVTSACNTIVKEYAWQRADAVGRNEIRQAIQAAEDRIREYLGFSPAPHYVIETLPFPNYIDRIYDRRGHWGTDMRWRTITVTEGEVQAVGVEALELIEADVAVAFSDQDGDGVNDTFILTASTALTDASQVAVYFSAGDRFDPDAGMDRWRIRPVTVSISGGTATIRGKAYHLVRPILYEGTATEAINPDTPGNFAATLDVYRHWTSPGSTLDTSQAVLIWETNPCPDWYTPCLSGADPAGEYYALARVGIHNAHRGELDIAESTYDASAGIWTSTGDCLAHCRPPDRVIVRYLAGVPFVAGRMKTYYRSIVARMAAAELNRPICACDAANRELYNWQFDLSRAAGANDEQYAVSGDALTNPFGTRRGHVYAWRQIMEQRLERGYAP